MPEVNQCVAFSPYEFCEKRGLWACAVTLCGVFSALISMAGERWIFSRSQLANTPSRKCGQSSDKELNWRQQAANLIQDMGQKLQVSQLCINTAIVFMHRFYMVQSFTRFHRNTMSTACLFLAAKVEEQPRKLEHVLKASHACLRREQDPLDVKSTLYLELAQDLVVNENILLQTLGFETTVEHPHTYVVQTCTLVRASKDLAQTSYFLATNSLHLTTMCLEYQPKVVACVCVHLACKWANWEIPKSSEGREWYWYVDKNVTLEMLEELTQDFLVILDKCPSKLKKKLMNAKNLDEGLFAHFGTGQSGKSQSMPGKSLSMSGKSQPGVKKPPAPSTVTSASAAMTSTSTSGDKSRADTTARPQVPSGDTRHKDQHAPEKSPAPSGGPSPKPGHQQLNIAKSESNLRRVRTEPVLTPTEYFERKERERLERVRIENERKKLAAEKERLGAETGGEKGQGGRPHGGASRPQQSGGDRDRHRPDQHLHRHHTNIFDKMREVPNSGDSHQSSRKSLEHRGKDRPHGEHGHSRPHSDLPPQSRAPPGEQRGVTEKPSHHREGGPGHERQNAPHRRETPIKQEPKYRPPQESRGGAVAPHTEHRPSPLLEVKPPVATPKVAPPPAPTVTEPPQLDTSFSPVNDVELTSQVEQLIQQSLQENPVPPSDNKSPLITVDDMDISDGDNESKSSTKSLAKAAPPPQSQSQPPRDSTVFKPITVKTEKVEPQEEAAITPLPVAPEQIKLEQSIKTEPEARPQTPESERQSLKIKLDLKAASSSSSSSRKHERRDRHSSDRSRREHHEKHHKHHKHHRQHHRHHHREDKEKHKEHKLKIKPPVPPDEGGGESEDVQPREKLKLKLNLKSMTTSSPVAGSSSNPAPEKSGELEPGEIEDDEDDDEYKASQSPNPMKLVLSKSRTGHYSSREHKHSRHSSSGSHHHRRSSSGERSRSRKRAHSPAESSRSQSTSYPQKMARSEQLRLSASNHEGASNGGRSGSPGVAHKQTLPTTPSQAAIQELDSKLKRVIELKTALLAHGGQPTPPGDSTPPAPQQ